MNTSIWQPLNHDTILSAVEATLNEKLSNLILTRNSYINRVYELEKFDSRERIIVKFYRPGRWTPDMILEEHNFLKELSVHEIPVIPPIVNEGKTLFSFGEIPLAIFPKKGGRAIDEFDKDEWEQIGRLLGRLHLIGEKHKTSKRVTWRPGVATKNHLEVLLKSGFLLPDFEKSFMISYDAFIKKADPLFENIDYLLLHGDCHKGNLIHRPGEGIFIVDFDDLCFGPAVQDLWMLLPDTPEKCENELSWFYKGYETFKSFDRSSLMLVPYLRGMRIIHFAAWLAVQSLEPDFKTHFPEAGTSRYWNQLVKELNEINFDK